MHRIRPFDEKRLKISIRRSNYLEDKIELDKVLRDGFDKLNLDSEVGGHSAAAGAIIIEDELVTFKTGINEILLES